MPPQAEVLSARLAGAWREYLSREALLSSSLHTRTGLLVELVQVPI